MEELYEGYGHKLTADSWARQLHITKALFKYIMEMGGSVEKMFELSRLKPNLPNKIKKQRVGARMEETKKLIFMLMVVSGYVGPDDSEDMIQVTLAGTNGAHYVSINDDKIGKFFYRENRLVLTGGEGLLFDAVDPGIASVVKKDGAWKLTEKTRIAMINGHEEQ